MRMNQLLIPGALQSFFGHEHSTTDTISIDKRLSRSFGPLSVSSVGIASMLHM
jgi:hypothetical protein